MSFVPTNNLNLIFTMLVKHSGDNVELNQSLLSMIPIVEHIVATNDARGSKFILKELNQLLAEAVPPEYAIELRKRILLDCGVDIFIGSKNESDRIEQIKIRGKIRSLPEYTIMQRRLESIWQDPNFQEEYKQIHKLVNEYLKQL